MKVTVDSKKGLKIDLRVIVDKKTINDQMVGRFEELKKTVNLKGFRPGKVPIEILKRQFGKAVYGEVLDKVLKESSSKALEDKKIKVAGQPKIDLKKYGEDKDLEYTIHVEQLPKIKIKGIEEIKITNYEIKTTNMDTDKRIKDIAKNQNNFEDKKIEEAATLGDLVIFNYKATIDGKDFKGGEGNNTQIILGKDLFIKDFDKQLIGIKKQEEKIVEVTLPENYLHKEYSNKRAKFVCKIVNIKSPKEIIINDELAKTLGAKDLNDLKTIVSKQIQEQYKNTLDTITKKEILDQLDKFQNIQIPENLIQQEIELLNHGIKNEEIEKNKKANEETAKKRIKTGLILNEFGEQNNLKVNEEEIKNEIQKQIQMMPDQAKQVTEYYQKNPSAVASLRGGIYEEKIISLIKEKAKSTKKNITTDEAEKIILAQNKESKKSSAARPKVQKAITKKPGKRKKVSKK
ncbi:MAG: trigger factor [Candidatus Pelagibacter sp.]|jgi:trigger factor|nr:trigger factor [Candidatus Pelagibacter sp.]|tara:strand:- start:3682 stop:5061 length:1380 start_codon:yes stop_codon:yes gene_type:complete